MASGRKDIYKDSKPFKKGQSGNPNGRPKKIPELRELLANVLGDEKDGKSAAEAILMALRNKAIKGDVRAAELLLDRAYGKAKQDFDISGSTITVIRPEPMRNDELDSEETDQ
jgi:hypothetical protein